MNAHRTAVYPLPLKILGLGRYLPKRVVSSSELEKRCGLPEGFCERKQGVRERRWVEDETLSFMGAQAANEAVANAGLTLAAIDLIIDASQGFEQAVPQGASLIQQQLGGAGLSIPGMSVTSACLGFLVALDVCASLLAVGRYRNILVVNAEIISAGLDANNPNVYTMMGDGAVATVVTRTPPDETSGIHALLMETYSEAVNVSSASRDNRRPTFFDKNLPLADIGFDFDPQFLQTTAMKHNQKFLAKLWPNADYSAFKLVIPNQASRLALDMMKFMFPAEKIMGIIDRFGNCGSVGYPLALYEAVLEKRLSRGDMVLLTGMGAGFSIIGMVLRY